MIDPAAQIGVPMAEGVAPVTMPPGGATATPRPATCRSCGGAVTPAAYPFVYAVGRLEPRFPRLGVEKEFAQLMAGHDVAGLTDPQALRKVLSRRENRYLARQLCWVFAIEGVETYLVVPRDPDDVGLLVEAIRPDPGPGDLDVIIGMRGPVAPPEMCNGLAIPIVICDHIYSFDRASLIAGIPAPDKWKGKAEHFHAVSASLFDRILRMADNSGATPEHVALNYLAVRYPPIYARAVEELAENAALTAVEARPSPLSGTRRLVDVIFTFTNRATDVADKAFVRVDVTDEFPFVATKLSPYYDRWS